MASGFLTPDGRLRVFSDLGVVLPGAKLHAYVAGTPSTNLDTFSNVGLTVANTNPVIASAGGLFGPIFLTPGLSYKLVLTDSADVVVWSQDNVANPVNTLAAGTGISLATVAGVTTITATGSAVPSVDVDDFRLTLESGVPVSATDQTAKGTLYCTPRGRGNRIDLYDVAGVPTTVTAAQFSIAIPATTGTIYSVWVYNNAGVATLELTAWTNDTTPGAGAWSISAVTGSQTKTGDLTRRFKGLVRTAAVAGQTEDSEAKRYVWNQNHRARRPVRRTDPANTWTYTTATMRQANGNPANQIDVVQGDAESVLDLTLNLYVANSGGGLNLVAGIGEDSTTTLSARQTGQGFLTILAADANVYRGLGTRLVIVPAIGRHFYSHNEYSQAANITTWSLQDPLGVFAQRGGLIGVWEC